MFEQTNDGPLQLIDRVLGAFDLTPAGHTFVDWWMPFEADSFRQV